jgi:tRNA (cmo5U34)-methyltransferase
MSGATPGSTWQSAEMTDSYLRRRETLIPFLDLQEELIGILLDRHPHAIARFLDVGCGAGAMSSLVFAHRPEAEGVGVDFSEPMLETAERELSVARWQAVRGDLSDPGWPDGLPAGAGYGAVVSGLAIHHLPAARKRGLFAEIFALLAPGGMFVNLDYVSVEGTLQGSFHERMVENAICAEHERGGERTPMQIRAELGEDGVGDEDLPDTAENQVQWLRDAGFEHAEIHFKWGEAAVYGGVRPSSNAGPQAPRT